jgi:hypothetical protein
MDEQFWIIADESELEKLLDGAEGIGIFEDPVRFFDVGDEHLVALWCVILEVDYDLSRPVLIDTRELKSSVHVSQLNPEFVAALASLRGSSVKQLAKAWSGAIEMGQPRGALEFGITELAKLGRRSLKQGKPIWVCMQGGY